MEYARLAVSFFVFWVVVFGSLAFYELVFLAPLRYDRGLVQRAASEKNQSICHEISDGQIIDECLLKTMFYVTDDGDCRRLESQQMADLCYKNLAENTNVSSYCDNIVAQSMSQACMSSLSSMATSQGNKGFLKNSSQCSLISNANDGFSCILENNATLADDSLCDRLWSQKMQFTVGYKNMRVTSNYLPKIICLHKVALDTNKSIYCGKISESNVKTYCYTDLAISQKDPRICGGLTSTSKDSCLDKVAYYMKDYRICEPILSYNFRDQCYRDIAPLFNDSRICDEIRNPNTKVRCYKKMGKAPADDLVCDNITNVYDRGDCYLMTAIKNREPSPCQHMNAYPNVQSLCYYNFAVALNESGYCAKVGTQSSKNSCYEKIGTATNNISVCDGIMGLGADQAKGRCYSNVAVSLSDPRICAKIFNSGWQSNCYGRVSNNLKQITLCENIDSADKMGKLNCYRRAIDALDDQSVCSELRDTEARDYCLDKFARKLSKPLLCELVSDKTKKAFCLRYSVASEGDAVVCERVEEEKSRDWCYWGIGEKTGDRHQCEQIVSQEYVDGCIWSVAIKTKDKILCGQIKNDQTMKSCLDVIWNQQRQ